MYTLLTRNILKNYRVSNKTIKRRGVVINEVTSLALVNPQSSVLIFFEHSIDLSYLQDLVAALDLKLILAVNNESDYNLCCNLFDTRLVYWDFIDGDLVTSILVNDEKQIEALTNSGIAKIHLATISGLKSEAHKMTVSTTASEGQKLVASALLNYISGSLSYEEEIKRLNEQVETLSKQKLALDKSLTGMSVDMSDFIDMYRTIQTQISARNIVDVIKDNKSFVIPNNLTSLVIKNYGVPHLLRFVMALKDSLTVSFDKYTKVLYIAEPDSVSIQEIPRTKFYLMTEETKASDLLTNDLLICIGNTRDPLEFLTSNSTMDALIIIDSRRTTTELITGQTMTLYTAPDIEAANNLKLDANSTITASERSKYTLRESDFVRKKSHALRNAELVLMVANTLLGKG